MKGKSHSNYGKGYWLGKKHSEETKIKMSEKSKKRKRDNKGRFI